MKESSQIVDKIVKWYVDLGSEQEIADLIGYYPRQADNPDELMINEGTVKPLDNVAKMTDGTIRIFPNTKLN